MSSSSEYNPRDFPPVAVTVDMVIFTIHEEALHVLLIKRGTEPFQNAWALPGGFIKPDEDLDAAAARELAEETGITGEAAYLEQLGSYGSPKRDPRMRVVTVVYWAICANLPPPVGGDDAAHAELVPLSMIEEKKIKLAFDHNEIVRDAMKRALERLEHPPIAAKFCSPQFTISELRKVYETIWNMNLDQGNFQRKIRKNRLFKNLSAEKNFQGPRGGRPASLWSIQDIDPAHGPPGRFEATEASISKTKRKKFSRTRNSND